MEVQATGTWTHRQPEQLSQAQAKYQWKPGNSASWRNRKAKRNNTSSGKRKAYEWYQAFDIIFNAAHFCSKEQKWMVVQYIRSESIRPGKKSIGLGPWYWIAWIKN